MITRVSIVAQVGFEQVLGFVSIVDTSEERTTGTVYCPTSDTLHFRCRTGCVNGRIYQTFLLCITGILFVIVLFITSHNPQIVIVPYRRIIT